MPAKTITTVYTVYGEHNHLIYLCLLLGYVVEVFADDDDAFMDLLFQDHIMRTVYNSYPEVMVFDATYKLTESHMPRLSSSTRTGWGSSMSGRHATRPATSLSVG